MAYFHMILQPLALLGMVILPSEALQCYYCTGDDTLQCSRIIACTQYQDICVTEIRSGFEIQRLSCGSRTDEDCSGYSKCCDEELCNGLGHSAQRGDLECYACRGDTNSQCFKNPKKASVQRCYPEQDTCLTATYMDDKKGQVVDRSCAVHIPDCGQTKEGGQIDCCNKNKCNSANSCQQNWGQLVFGLLLAVTAVFIKN